MQIYMYVHTRERDSCPGFDGVKIKLLLFQLEEKHFHKTNYEVAYFFIFLSFIYYSLVLYRKKVL